MNRILIYNAVSLASSEIRKNYVNSISYKRLEKINRLKKDEDKALSLSAALLLKEGLSRYGIEERNADYDEKYPYPVIKGREDICISLSHSFPYAVCTFSDKKTGVDIEKIKNFNPKICDKFFTFKEISYINSKKDKNKAFFTLWTLKESAAKLYGTPLAESLKKYEFLPESDFFIKNNIHYSLFEYNGFMIAAASESGYFSL